MRPSRSPWSSATVRPYRTPFSLPVPRSGPAIVNQFSEASPGLATSSVIALGAVLLLLTVAVNIVGQFLLRRRSSSEKTLPPGPPADPSGAVSGFPGTTSDTVGVDGDSEAGHGWRQIVGESSRRSLPRRRLYGRVGQVLCALAVVAGAAPLVAFSTTPWLGGPRRSRSAF